MYSLASLELRESLYRVSVSDFSMGQRTSADTRTTDWYTDGVTVLISDGNVDVGRKVTAIELWREVLVHVLGNRVDIEFMARELVSEFGKGGKQGHCVLSDSHDIVGQVKHELVGLRQMVRTACAVRCPSLCSLSPRARLRRLEGNHQKGQYHRASLRNRPREGQRPFPTTEVNSAIQAADDLATYKGDLLHMRYVRREISQIAATRAMSCYTTGPILLPTIAHSPVVRLRE